MGCNRGFNTQKSEFIQLGGLVNDINLRYDKNNNQYTQLAILEWVDDSNTNFVVNIEPNIMLCLYYVCSPYILTV